MRFHPRLLITFRNLLGGQYGTLDVTARDSGHLELALGADFVWMTRDQWLELRRVADKFFHIERELCGKDEEPREHGHCHECQTETKTETDSNTIVIANDEDWGKEVIVEQHTHTETETEPASEGARRQRRGARRSDT
jgi:hypothetical protein